jgi:carboxypeptidase Ss1
MDKTQLDSSLHLAQEIHQELIHLRRDLHMYPEIGFDLPRTAQVVSKTLSQYGLPVKTGVAQSGVVSDLIIPGATHTIALRADMDALPIQEQNDVPYKSLIEQRGHLCGHDAHTSMLLGAAKILVKLKDQLKVNVRFIFQPSEEAWPGGASVMIEEGVLDGVDEIYAQHVWPTLPVGHYGLCEGYAMAQSGGFKIIINGRGGHAATPQETIDPIIVSSHLIQALQKVVPDHLKDSNQAILTITQVHSGHCDNAIPDSSFITGTVRTYEKNVQQMIKHKFFETINEVTNSYGATAEIEFYEGYPALYNHPEKAKHVYQLIQDLVDETSVDYPAQKVLFGEDFAYYTEKIKGCFIRLGCRNEGKNITHLLHDSKFDIDEDCLIFGTALFVKLALKL